MAITLTTSAGSSSGSSSVSINVNVNAGDLVVVGRSRGHLSSAIAITVNGSAVTMIRDAEYASASSNHIAVGYSRPSASGLLAVASSDATATTVANIQALVYSGVQTVQSTAYSTGATSDVSVTIASSGANLLQLAYTAIGNSAANPGTLTSGPSVTLRQVLASSQAGPGFSLLSGFLEAPGTTNVLVANSTLPRSWGTIGFSLLATPAAGRGPTVWQ